MKKLIAIYDSIMSVDMEMDYIKYLISESQEKRIDISELKPETRMLMGVSREDAEARFRKIQNMAIGYINGVEYVNIKL